MPAKNNKFFLRLRCQFILSILWCLILTNLLTSCARFQSQPLAPGENAKKLEERTLTDVRLRTFLQENLQRQFPHWPPEAWDFDMLTMAALLYHPSLELARAQLDVALGGKMTAAQRPNPTLNVTPGYNFTTITPSPWLPLGSIDVPVETAGKRRYRREQATHRSEAAGFSVLSGAWQVRAELRAALLDFTAAEKRAAFLADQTKLWEQTLDRLEQQIRAGAIAPSEALQVRLSLAKSRLDSAENERQRAEARVRVASALGVPLSALENIRMNCEFRVDQARVTELSSADVRRLALTSRPDILGALAEYAAAESALHLEIARQFPDLRLAPGYEYDQGDSKWSLGLTVDLPVLNQNQGPIAEARARRGEAAARFNLVQARALSEIDHAVETLKTTGRNYEVFSGVTRQQRQKRDSVAAQMAAGAVDRLALLSAELDLAAAELSQFEAELKVQQSFGSLEDAVQRPFQMPAGAIKGGSAHAL